MKQIFKYYLKVRGVLKTLLYLSILTYGLIELVFDNYNEIFNGAYKVGVFFSSISISYIASFIFYFIVVHIKEQQDKETVKELIGHEVYKIITSAHLLIQPFQEKFNKKERFRYLNRAELRKLLAMINIRDKESPLNRNGENTSWLEWYEDLKNSTDEAFKVINIRYGLIDSELVKILYRIEKSLFFSQFRMLYDDRFGPTFVFFEIQLFSYLSHIKELEEYADKNLAEYKYHTSDFVGLKNITYDNPNGI